MAARWALLAGPIRAVSGSRGRELESYRETECGEQGEQGKTLHDCVTGSMHDNGKKEFLTTGEFLTERRVMLWDGFV